MKSIDGCNKNNSVDFYLDPSILDLEIVKRIAIQKSPNSLILEVNNQTISQTIFLDDFANKTILPLKKQLDWIIPELQSEERKKITNSIITCINKNIDEIVELSKQDNSNDRASDENSKVANLISLTLKPENIEKLFKDQYGKPYVAVRLDVSKQLEILPINSTRFKHYLSNLYCKNFGSYIGEG